MTRMKLYLSVWFLLICSAVSLCAQQAALPVTNAVVPPVVKFSGVLTDTNNTPLTGTVDVTFSLYQQSQGGAPLGGNSKRNRQQDRPLHSHPRIEHQPGSSIRRVQLRRGAMVGCTSARTGGA